MRFERPRVLGSRLPNAVPSRQDPRRCVHGILGQGSQPAQRRVRVPELRGREAPHVSRRRRRGVHRIRRYDRCPARRAARQLRRRPPLRPCSPVDSDPVTPSHAVVAIFVIVTATATARANDPDAVRGLTRDLDALDATLDQGKLEHIWIDASRAYQWFDTKQYPDLRSDPSYASLQARFRQLAIKAAKIAGGKSVQIVGDGTSVAKDADKLEAFK